MLTQAQMDALLAEARNYAENVAETSDEFTAYVHGLCHAAQVLAAAEPELYEALESVVPDDHQFAADRAAAALDNFMLPPDHQRPADPNPEPDPHGRPVIFDTSEPAPRNNARGIPNYGDDK